MVFTEMDVLRLTLAVIVGTLAGIVYSLRVLFLIERRVARIEEHMDNIVHKVLTEEIKIERALKKRK